MFSERTSTADNTSTAEHTQTAEPASFFAKFKKSIVNALHELDFEVFAKMYNINLAKINAKNSSDEYPLLLAIAHSNDATKFLLTNYQVDLNVTNASNDNALHLCVLHNKENVIPDLLNYAKKHYHYTEQTPQPYQQWLNATNKQGLTPFQLALVNNSASCLHYLLAEAHIEVNTEICEYSPILYTAYYNMFDIYQILVQDNRTVLDQTNSKFKNLQKLITAKAVKQPEYLVLLKARINQQTVNQEAVQPTSAIVAAVATNEVKNDQNLSFALKALETTKPTSPVVNEINWGSWEFAPTIINMAHTTNRTTINPPNHTPTDNHFTSNEWDELEEEIENFRNSTNVAANFKM